MNLAIFKRRVRGAAVPASAIEIDPEGKVRDDIAALEKLMEKDDFEILRERIGRSTSPLIGRLEEVKSMLLVQQPMEEEERKLKGVRRALENDLERVHGKLEKITKAFEAGYSLTNPNKDWYCGFFSQGAIKRSDLPEWEIDGISKHFPSKGIEGEYKVLFFNGVIPPHIQTAYLRAREIFGEAHIRIYSPSLEDFKSVNLHPDPLMIGMIQDVPGSGDLLFLIAVWNLKKDLEKLP